MTTEEWTRKLQHLIKQMPPGIELLVTGEGRIDIYPVDTLYHHMESEFNGYGIQEDAIATIKHPRVHPYGEGV